MVDESFELLALPATRWQCRDKSAPARRAAAQHRCAPAFSSPGIIDIWEAAATLAQFLLFVATSYCQDRGWSLASLVPAAPPSATSATAAVALELAEVPSPSSPPPTVAASARVHTPGPSPASGRGSSATPPPPATAAKGQRASDQGTMRRSPAAASRPARRTTMPASSPRPPPFQRRATGLQQTLRFRVHASRLVSTGDLESSADLLASDGSAAVAGTLDDAVAPAAPADEDSSDGGLPVTTLPPAPPAPRIVARLGPEALERHCDATWAASFDMLTADTGLAVGPPLQLELFDPEGDVGGQCTIDLGPLQRPASVLDVWADLAPSEEGRVAAGAAVHIRIASASGDGSHLAIDVLGVRGVKGSSAGEVSPVFVLLPSLLSLSPLPVFLLLFSSLWEHARLGQGVAPPVPGRHDCTRIVYPSPSLPPPFHLPPCLLHPSSPPLLSFPLLGNVHLELHCCYHRLIAGLSHHLDAWLECASMVQLRGAAALAAGVNGGQPARPPSAADMCLHALCFYWKLLFAAIPPAGTGGGWPALAASLMLIAAIAAVLVELADLFSCASGLPVYVTAITLVAAGTSMPDLLASRLAARLSDRADAAVSTVTGSNSTNVFLGLGLPWLATALHDRLRSRHRFRVEAGVYEVSLAAFFGAAVAGICALAARRVLAGVELGGSRGSAWATATLLAILWATFIAVSSARAYAAPPAAG
eukprot:SM000172S03092  [mRNA]  locus=s172:270425:276242:- [translate_table: standard]